MTVNVPLSTSLKQIAQTTVTAHAGPDTNPASVNQLTRSDIQTSPVNNSLDRLLETLPGVVQFSYNEPVINGFHGVTYNIDGAPLPLATTSNFAEIVDLIKVANGFNTTQIANGTNFLLRVSAPF